MSVGGWWVVVLLLLPAASATTLTARFLSGVDPRAVCVDGSPAAYYFAPGASTGASTWIVHLEGGGWCYDDVSCAKRCPEDTSAPLCSSKSGMMSMPICT